MEIQYSGKPEEENQASQKVIKKAVELSTEKSPNYKKYTSVNGENIMTLISTLGLDTVKQINDRGWGLLVSSDGVDTKAKNTNAGSDNTFEKIGLAPDNYSRNDFATIVEDRILFISTFQKKDKISNSKSPAKVAQFDFMFLDDYFSPEDSDISYSKSKKLQTSGKGEDLDLRGLSFLRSLRDLIESVSSDTLIQICPSDEKRERIYRKALGHLPNTKFIITKH